MRLGAALGRVVLFTVLIAIAVALTLVRGFDGPPPDDADLMVVPSAPLDHDNAFLTLTSAAALLAWPADESLEASWRKLARGEDCDDAIAAQAVAANERALEAFARAARQAAFHSPQPDAPVAAGTWLDLARVQGIRAIALARTGEAERALAEAGDGLRVARLVGADSNGRLLVGALATEMGRASLDALRAVLDGVPLTAERARRLDAELISSRSDPAAWRVLLAAEYRALRSIGDLPRAPVVVPAGHPGLDLLASALPDSHLYQPNNTRSLLAVSIRERMQAAAPACSAQEPPPFEITLVTLLAPNAAGRQMLDQAISPSIDLFRCRYDTQLEALRAVLAVRGFESERRVLPPSLAALVPEYASAIPGEVGVALHLDRAAREVVAGKQRFPLLPPPGAR